MTGDGGSTPRRVPASGAEIARIVGGLDDAAIAAILATGATGEEVAEAYAWLTADDDMHRQSHRRPQGAVATVCDILEAELLPPERE